jgi:protein-tyrosine-phosphatase/DNA-binding transcriptional ArsR family regulator
VSAGHWTEQQDQDRQPKERGHAVFEELNPDIVRRQLLRRNPGADHDRDKQAGTEELGEQTAGEGWSWFSHTFILTDSNCSVNIEAMNVERVSELERRVAKHAALADPARLRIVDGLSVGDASPSELSTLLGMSSNLLAHHLNVLAAQGIVTKGSSEGDRRRSYVRLVPGSLQGLTPALQPAARRVVFVCTANSARSHMAAALWKRSSRVPAASAGTHPADRIDPRAIASAARHDFVLPDVAPQSMADVIRDGDLIVTVCDSAHEELGTGADLHWSIPDPVRAGSAKAFDQAFDSLNQRVSDLAPRVIPS